jgi:hypothetical protein
MVDRIKSAVNSTLASKGWAEVPSGGDAAIVAVVTTQTQEALRTFYDGFGGAGAGAGLEDLAKRRQHLRHILSGLWSLTSSMRTARN